MNIGDFFALVKGSIRHAAELTYHNRHSDAIYRINVHLHRESWYIFGWETESHAIQHQIGMKLDGDHIFSGQLADRRTFNPDPETATMIAHHFDALIDNPWKRIAENKPGCTTYIFYRADIASTPQELLELIENAFWYIQREIHHMDNLENAARRLGMLDKFRETWARLERNSRAKTLLT